ncbi:uncharacterized protein LOC120067641 [Benincasa hispida]|uniref:uncharacterized protein LOC120067641 n=1 Tax=Benincasa hispida TaxID=102211 RepID=UPI00190162F7|nr:uncharacterized protein LOC120067641 [Benincasa hispida]
MFYWNFESRLRQTAMVVGQLMKDKFTGIGRIYKPCHIVEDMRRDYGVNISYDKVWHARETAYDLTRGIPEYSYSILHAYGEALKIENSGTVFEIKLEHEVHFKYMFMVLGPCIRGFTSCRPCIIVDGSHLKEKYKGTIIGEPDNLVFVSYRMVSIDNVIRAFFPTTFHGLCTWHLEQNLVTNFKDSTVVGIFRYAVRAFCMTEFQTKLDELCSFRDGVVTKYLEDMGLQRNAPIVVLRMEELLGISTTLHSDYCETRLASEADKGRLYRVEPIDCYRVHTRDNRLDGIINLHTKECMCKEFDSLGILCSHAIIAVKERNIPIHSLCSQFYTVDSLMTAYAEPINPLGHISE